MKSLRKIGSNVIMVTCLFLMTNQVFGQSETVLIKNAKWNLIGDWQSSETSELRGVVLLLHKASGNRRAYERMASLLSQRGYASLRVDLRGHGESTNVRAFDPDTSRFEDPENPEVTANFELIKKGYLDVIAAIKWLKKHKKVEKVPFVIVGASYTGEEMVKAAETVGFADIYIALAPGNFSANSIAKIDPMKKPWLFVRAEKEMSFIDNIFTSIEKGSNAEIWVISGKGHATDLFMLNDDLEKKLIDWIDTKYSEK